MFFIVCIDKLYNVFYGRKTSIRKTNMNKINKNGNHFVGIEYNIWICPEQQQQQKILIHQN